MELFKLLGTIAINNQGAMSAIDTTVGAVGKLAKTTGKIFTAVGTTVVKGIAVSSAAVGALVKQSIGNYKEYEQLVGGVETLFKDSSGTVMKYANDAWKTAGLSANDYMSTVTSFSASLLQSLKGDTEQAAKVADMALTDMADNANKMGTSMNSIQDAYQGFAKQNYTMLDNLKLGYGGTKTEMQRLLKDAQKLSGVKYNIKNLDDVYEAIHVIQESMGIAGTTALEATETIGGSLSAMGSSWSNLVTGIADDSQDLNKLVDNFAESAQTAFRNITARIPSIVQGINTTIQALTPELTGMISEMLPGVLQGATTLITGLVSALPGMLETLFALMPGIIEQLVASMQEIWPALVSAISNGWNNVIWPGIQDLFVAHLGIELPDTDQVFANIESALANIKSFCTDVGKWVSENQALILSFLGAVAIALLACGHPLLAIGLLVLLVAANWETLKMAVNTAIEAVKEFFTEKIPEWWEREVIQPIKDAWAIIEGWINDAATAISNFFSVTLPAGWSTLTDSISSAWSGIVSWINGAIEALKEFLGLNGASPSVKTKPSYGATSGATTAVKGGARVMYEAYSDALIDGTHASGLNFVPKDNYIAKLHYGEAVLNAKEASAWRNNGDGIVQQLVEELPDMLVNAFASMRFDVNNREFARMVKAVT